MLLADLQVQYLEALHLGLSFLLWEMSKPFEQCRAWQSKTLLISQKFLEEEDSKLYRSLHHENLTEVMEEIEEGLAVKVELVVLVERDAQVGLRKEVDNGSAFRYD